MTMKLGIPRELHPNEQRVAAAPSSVRRLVKMGFAVLLEKDAGVAAGLPDELFEEAGAEIRASAAELYAEADIVLKVRPPDEYPELGAHEADLIREGCTLISFLWPARNETLLQRLADRGITALAMDAVPRITRAQKMDALSSMANIAGYRAVIEAAQHFPSFFTAQMTAAGKTPPAKVLVIGAGVAGLAAIGAARSLGAIVRAFDVREAAAEQVESMGADFLRVDMDESGEGEGGYAKEMSQRFLEAEMALFEAQAREVDIIITTALVPGKKAPVLLPKRIVEAMKPGSVIVDLAAEQGGNCELTRPGEVYAHRGVTLVGHEDLPSRMAKVASSMYGTNLAHLLDDMGGAEGYRVDFEDEVTRGALVCHEGKITWPPPPPKSATGPAPAPEKKPAEAAPVPVAPSPPKRKAEGRTANWWLLAIGAGLLGMGWFAPQSFLAHLTVFVLAIFLGWQVIWNVTAALHTPLMSVTNAISGIIIIGGMLQISGETMSATTILGAVAILVASINVAGGFLVTQRMLQMFRKEG
jgi:NAD(P) transhydrogenase subunit alpha